MSMKPEALQETLAGLREAQVSVACFLPESLMKELYPALIDAEDIRAIPVTNEGEGAAICGGVYLSGKRAVLAMENSGLRAATEALARMGLGARIPIVMLMSYRGDLGEPNWWGIPHGVTMEPLLQALRIPYTVVRSISDIRSSLTKAFTSAYTSMYHYAVILAGECTDFYPSVSSKTLGVSGDRSGRWTTPRMQMHRYDCMMKLAGLLKDELVILSLGGSVDEWYNAAPQMRSSSLFQQQLGCVTPEAFGLAVGLPHRKVIAMDTDGGMLFNLGILATLANETPDNLLVIVWDNECYQSIGGPPTHTAGCVDLNGIARGAGIKNTSTVRNLDDFERAVKAALELDELYVIIAKVSTDPVPGIIRKASDGIEDRFIFARHVENSEGVTIMGPSEHN
jgi:sulfopyruvate decarboxylase TPP-binding subunit